jgi:DNA-binding transcriptional MerR regulator
LTDTPVYSAKEVAALLDVGESTVRRWKSQKLVEPSARTGGIYPRGRYTIDDLIRARVVQALLSVPLRGKELSVAVESTIGAVRGAKYRSRFRNRKRDA